MRAAADRHPVGVAGDEPHTVERYAEPFGHQLRKAGFVALPVRHRADDDFDNALRQHRHFGAFARRAGRGIDVIGDADAAVSAAPCGLGPPGREPGPVAERQHPRHRLVVFAAVIDHAERVGVRHGGFGDEVAAAQFQPVEAALTCGAIDQPFHDKDDLGASGAAIGAGRDRVGHRCPGAEMHCRHVIDARHDLDALDQRPKRDRVGPDIGNIRAAHREEVSIGVERQLRSDGQIARLVIAQKRFLPLAGPFDRPADTARRPGDRANSGLNAPRVPKLPPTSCMTTRILSSGTSRIFANSCFGRTAPPIPA